MLFKECISRRVRVKTWSTILLLVLSISLAGCQSSGDAKPDIKTDWEIKPSPPQVGKATLNLTLRDSTDQPISGANVKLEGNMSHPGMEPVIANAVEMEPGQYSADINFTMAGDWFIIITTTFGDSIKQEKQIKVTGVRSE